MIPLPLHTYVAEVEAITPIPNSEIPWAMKSCHGGIPPEQFARWISLTASPSASPAPPLAPPQDGASDPLQVHESLEGEEFKMEEA